MTDTTTDPATMDVMEAAQYIGMSPSWLARSDVPRVRLGRRVLYLRADLDAFLVQRRSHGSAA